MRNLSLRARLLSGTILVLSAVLLIIAVLMTALSRPQDDSSAEEQLAQHLTEQLDQAAAVADNSARILELAGLGSPTFRDGLVRQNVDAHPLVFGSAIAFLPEFQPPGENKAPYAYRSGNKVLLTDLAQAYDFTLGSQWFIEPVRLHQPRWSAPYFDDGGGNVWMITYSVPVFREESVLGVLTIDVAIDQLAALVEVGPVQLLDANGQTLNSQGEDLQLPLLPLGSSGLSLRWQDPRQKRDLSGFLAALVVTLALAGLMVWLLIKYHTRPLYTLVRGFRALQDGQPASAVTPAGAPELKELGVCFNRLLGGPGLSDKGVLAGEFIDHLPGIAFRLDGNDRVIFVNPQVQTLTGYVPEDFMTGSRPFKLCIHPDDRARVEEELAQAIAARRPYAVEYRLCHRLGGQRWVAERGDPLFDGNGQYQGRDGAVFDIADKQSARERLERREQLLTAIFKEVPTGLASIDKNGKVTECNPALADLLGLTTSQLKGALITSFFGVEDRRYIQGQLARMQDSSGDFTWEGALAGASGQGRWVQLAWRSLDEGRSVMVVTDLDARRGMERAVQEAKEAADEASRAKSDFLANMSHEIRTPMNAILGFTQLAQEQDGASPYLGKIQQASKTLLRILNDILDFSKIEAGKLSIEKVDFHLEDTLTNLRDIFADKAVEKQVELVFNLLPDCPSRLHGDPHRLSQILMNLISNALKFTEKGEVVVSVQQHQPGWLQFSVRDTGIGMTGEQVGKLFQAFSQADSSTTRRFGGTGLGLAICQRLCLLMGGDIEVRSELGRGSLFTFSLPLVAEGEEGSYRQVAALQGCQALVVDDNETQLTVLEGLMSAYGFSVRSALGGEQALEMCRQAMPELLVVDWQMPGMDGLALAQAVQQLPEQPKALLMVSAFSNDKLVKEALALGIREVLLKPVSPSTLLDAVCEALGASSGRLPVRRAPDGQGLRYPALAGKKVLLVDDNDLNREVAQSFLVKAGVQVLLAKDGQDALDKLAGRGADLVLMDCQMPIMDGFEATRRLRQQPQWQDLPVIAMTANVMEGDKERCLAAGMNDHIAKPLDVPLMFEVIARWLGVEGQGPEQPQIFPEGDWPSHPELDINDGLGRVMQDTNLYKRVLVRFAEQADVMLAPKDPQTDLRHLHTLKGLLGNIGAAGLADKARDAEARLKGGADSAPLLAEVKNALGGLLAAIRAWQPAPDKPSKAPLAPAIKDSLVAMRPVLLAADAQALDELEAILARQPELKGTLGALRSQLELFDFDQALVQLDALLEDA
ncbi:response regulator [Gallaecimonas xiamenensis]|uniref:response regulator n=1 Tax=Gallaecimonas xiamenensis TaxID=1207039 RepID=UPI0004BA28C1|nr:response regulator [Gallaecimonas xiamenensis]